MAAMVQEFVEGEIDLFAGTWECKEHGMTMRVTVPCPFCAVEDHGHEILKDLALPRFY